MLTFPSFSSAGFLHAYSVRSGGTSEPPYHSLNLGDHVGDAPERVGRNRAIFSAEAGVSPERWVTAEQVHGSEVACVDESDAGRKIPGVDALVTATPDLSLVLFFADCASVLLADPARRAIGLAHAGWRGTAARIAEKTAAAMAEAFGSRPGDLRAAVGPRIGPCCYEVGGEVADALGEWEGAVRERGGSRFADLGAANRAQLKAAGLREENVFVSPLCAACEAESFLSDRRDGRTGRMAALLMLASG
jgi:YfiH family protein